MRIVVAGGSGLLGSHLVDQLRDRGHDVVQLVRRVPESTDQVRWDPAAGDLDQRVVDEADVVVNVAGTSLLGIPYSPRWQRGMRESRIGTTALLAEAVARAPEPPALLAQNGSSWYGDHGADPVTEASDSRGEAFLTRLTRDWEAAAEPARRSSARVCILRTAPVVDRSNPLLKLQTPLFKAFLGARLSSGEQYFPVVSLRDWVGAAVHLAEHVSASGAFNLCAPQTPTNAAYTEAFARAVGRTAFLVAPAPALKIAAGPMAPEMLNSVNLRPAALLASGYEFADPDVDSVLAAGLG